MTAETELSKDGTDIQSRDGQYYGRDGTVLWDRYTDMGLDSVDSYYYRTGQYRVYWADTVSGRDSAGQI